MPILSPGFRPLGSKPHLWRWNGDWMAAAWFVEGMGTALGRTPREAFDNLRRSVGLRLYPA